MTKTRKQPWLAWFVALTLAMSSATCWAASDAIQLDGTGDYMSVPDSSAWAFGTGDFTIEFWMTLANLSRQHDGLFGRNDYQWLAMEYQHDANNRRLSLWIDSNGSSGWNLDKRNGGTKTDWVADQWYHIAVVRSGTAIRVYVDGVLDMTGTFSGSVYNPSGVPLYIGRSQLSTRYHQGKFDEFRIWDHARTQADLLTTINSEVSENAPGLVACWRFNESAGSTAFDATVGDHDGTLTGDAAFAASDAPVNQPLPANGPFASVSPTGRPYNIVIANAGIDGGALAAGSQVAVYDGALCVGSAVYNGSGNLQLTAWEGTAAPLLPGFTVGHDMTFKVRANWFSDVRVFDATPAYTQGDGKFGTEPYSVANLSVSTGIAPDIALSPALLNFDAITINTSKNLTFDIQNTGDGILQVSNITSSNARFTVDLTTAAINPSSSRTATVTFTPNTVANYEAQLTVTSDDPDEGSSIVQLYGMGLPTPTPDIVVSPAALDFGGLVTGSNGTLTFNVRNAGNGDLTVTNITSSNAAYTIVGATGFTLTQGQNQDVTVRFAPTAASIYDATLTIANNDAAAYVSVSGFGYAGHFGAVQQTGTPYTILVPDVAVDGFGLQTGEEVAVFDGATLVGVTGAGRGGKALNLDGSGDYVDVPDSDSLDLPTALTFEAWMYVRTISETWKGVIGKPGRNYTMWLNSSRYIHFSYENTAGTSVTISTPNSSINLNQWHHVAGVLDVPNNVFRVYIDGVQKASGTPNGSPRTSGTAFRMGGNLDGGSGNWLDGKLDEVRVWNYARSQTAIQQSMYRRLSGTEQGLVGYWPFDDGTLTDASPQSNTGALYGNAQLVDGGAVPAGLQLTAWQKDVAQGLPGFTPGNLMTFKVWTATYGSTTEVAATPTYLLGNGTFGYQPYSVCNLAGSTNTAPDIDVSTNRLYVGQVQVGQSAQNTFTISNTSSNAALNVTSIAEYSSQFSVTPASATIPAGDNTTVTATFTPTTAGNHTTTLRIDSNDPDESYVEVTLEGFAMPSGVPLIELSAAALDFGGATVLTSKELTFHVINTGTAPLSITNITSDNGKFTVFPTAFTVTGTNETREVTVSFNPTTTSAQFGRLTVTSNAGTRYVSVAGVGNDGHFAPVATTGQSYQIVVASTDLDDLLQIGDEIAVLDGTTVVGEAVVQGTALAVDGSGDYVEVADSATLRPAQLTVEAWLKPSSYINHSTAVMKSSSSSWNDGYGLAHYTAANDINFFVTNYSSYKVSGTLPTGAWAHVAGTYDGAWLRLYVNGSLVSSTAYSGGITHSTSPLLIGKGAGGGYEWNGLIDEVRVWSVARGASDIQASMNSSLTGTEPGLVGYWRFNGTPRGSSAGGNNGTLYGNAAVTGAQPPVLPRNYQITAWAADPGQGLAGYTPGHPMTFKTWMSINGYRAELNATPTPLVGDGTFGNGAFSVVTLDIGTADIDVAPASVFKAMVADTTGQETLVVSNSGNASLSFDVTVTPAGYAASFAGSSQYLQIPSLTLGADYTLEAWAKFPLPATSGGWRTLYQQGGNHHHVLVQSDGQLGVYVSGFYSCGFDVDTLSAGWHFISAVGSGSQTTFYVDGTPVGVSSTKETGTITYLGNTVGGGQNFGRIDECRIWDQARAQVDIQNTMYQRLTGSETGLVGYWTFDDGTARDLTTGGRNGTLVNGASLVNDAPWSMGWVTPSPTTGVVLPGQSTDLTLAFDATGLFDGMYDVDIVLTNNTPGGSPVTVPITLNVTGDAQISSSTDTIAFGSVVVGQNKTLTYDLTNIGTDTLTIDSIAVQGAVGFATVSNPGFPLDLLPLQSHTFSVQFTPAASGAASDTLLVTSNAANSPSHAIALTGTGLTPADIAVDPTSWTGTLASGTIEPVTIGVTNNGQDALTFTVTESLSWLSVSPTSGSVAATQTQELTASVSTIGVYAGNYTGAMTIASNDPDTPSVQVSFDLTVTGQPQITAADNVQFGQISVGEVGNANLQVHNTGTDTLHISAVTSSNPTFGYAGNQSVTVAPGASTNLGLTFTPPAAGSHSGTLTLVSDAATTPSLQVALQGTGNVPPDIDLVPTSFTKSLAAGDVVNDTLTIRNLGGNPLNFNLTLAKPGKSALALDGDGDYVSVPSSASLNPGSALTIEAWVYLTDNHDEFIAAKESSGVGPYRLWVNASSKFEFRLNNAYSVVSTASAATGQWTHVAATFDGATLSLYVNGDLDGQLAFPAFAISANSENLRLGRSWNNLYFAGRMDEMRVWNVTRNQSEVQAMMNQSLTATETGLVLYFRFDETSGNVAYDATTHHQDGTLFGGATRAESTVPINQFLSATPTSGSVAAGRGTQAITLTFDATGLISNTYTQTITITSNDPDEPQVTVPVTLNVTGQGLIAVSATDFAFGNTFIGITNALPLTVTNNGSEAITITDWDFSNAEFSVSRAETEVSPYASKTVSVFFAPAQAGARNGTLTITSNAANDPDVVVTLAGTGIEPPVIGTDPDLFDVSLDFNTTTTQNLTISNTGATDLAFAILSAAGSGAGRAMDLNGAGYGEITNPAQYNDQTLTLEVWVAPDTTATANGTTAFARLDQSGGIIAGLRVWSGSTTNGLGQSGYEIITNGGSSGQIPYDFAAGQWAHVAVVITSTEARMVVNGIQVYSMAKLPLNYSAPDNFRVGADGGGNQFVGVIDELRIWTVARSVAEINATKNQQLTGTEPGLVGYYRFEDVGRTVQVGDDSPNDNVMTLSGNALLAVSTAPISSGGSGVTWLSFTPASGTVAPLGSQIVQLGFNAQDLAYGSYDNDLTISSNDVVNGLLGIPVSLSVNAPVIALSPASLAFGSVSILGNQTLQLQISNTGNRDLQVTDYSVNPADGYSFPGGVQTITVPAGQSRNLDVQFAPPAVASYNATLTLVSNLGNRTVPLTGSGYQPAPEIQVTPTSVTVNATEGQAVNTATFTIDNLGEAPLTGTLATGLAWVTVAPSSFDIPAAQNQQITVTADATGILPGNYNTQVTIANNDSNENPTQVAAAVHVGPDPNIVLPVNSKGLTVAYDGTLDESFVVQNQGLGSLGLTVTANAAWIKNVVYPATVPPGESRNVTYTVDANGLSGGTHNSSLSITSNDPTSGNPSYGITLTIVAPAIQLNTNSLSANLRRNRTTVLPLEVSNTGSSILQANVVGIGAYPWASVSPTTLNVPAGQKGTFSFTFSSVDKLEPSLSSGTVQITHNDPLQGAKDVTLSMNVSSTGGGTPVYGTFVRSMTPSGLTNVAVSYVDLTFDHAIQSGSFTVADVTVLGPSRESRDWVPSQITQQSSVVYRVTFASPINATGNYIIEVGPAILSDNGKWMDQDQDGIEQEAGDDVFRGTFTLDLTPPEPPTVTSHPVAPTVTNWADIDHTVTLTGTRPDNTALWIGTTQYAAAEPGVTTWLVPFTLAEGANDLSVYTKDPAGNASSSVHVLFYVDTTVPYVSQIFPQHNLLTRVPPAEIAATFVETGSGLDLPHSSFTLTRSGGSVPGTVTLAGSKLTFTPDGNLLDGVYTIAVQLKDNFGWQSVLATSIFTLDMTPSPAPVLDPAPPATTTVNHLLISGTRESGASIWLNGSQVVAGGANTLWSYDTPLVPGPNALSFTAKDPAGNESAPTLANVTFDDVAPGPVTLLANGASSGTQVLLSWTDYNEGDNGGDIQTYRVYQHSAPFTDIGVATEIGTRPAGQKTFTATALQRNQTYHFAVVAVDVRGNFGPTVTSVSATTQDVQPPAEITNPHVQSFDTQLILSWTHSANTAGDLDQYRVSVNASRTDYVVANTDNTLTVTNLQRATEYNIVVKARDVDGNESTGVAFKGYTLMDNPANVLTTGKDGRVDLTWNASQPAPYVKHYAVYASTTNFASVQGLVAVTTTTGTSTSVTRLNNDITYYFAVTAVNKSDGETKAVTTVTGQPIPDREGPDVQSVTFAGSAVTEGMTVTAPGTFAVAATDPSGMSRVEFWLDGALLGSDASGSDGYTAYWNVIAATDGPHVFLAKAYDSRSNSTDVQRTLTVALAPPSQAPAISAPAPDTYTNVAQATVRGTAPLNTSVRLYRNNVELGVRALIPVASNGAWSTTITLTEGENRLQAAAVNRAGEGPLSSELLVTLDTSVPLPPVNVTVTPRAAGVLRIAWRKPNLNPVKGFNLYRATTEFESIGQATLVNTGGLLRDLTYDDLPATDGQYFYRLTIVNMAGTESTLSALAAANADSVPPKALTVQYTPHGPHDPATGRTAPGLVDVDVVFSEALLAAPFFSVVPTAGIPISVTLNAVPGSDTHYIGAFSVTDLTPSGTAIAVMSARDAAGNRGTEIVLQAQIAFDTDGPNVTSLTLAPGHPIQNIQANPVWVTVTLVLTETLKPATSPTLTYTLSQSHPTATPIAGLTQVTDRAWTGTFQLPADAGLAAAEWLEFQYSGSDDLDNVSTRILAPNHVQVYQGDLPPLSNPLQLTGDALPGGIVFLAWDAVPEASDYQIYRKPKTRAGAWTVVGRSGGELYFQDQPADGEYTYAVAAVRSVNGQETISEEFIYTVDVVVDSQPPEAPTNLQLQVAANGIYLTWTDALNIENVTYSVFREATPTIESVDGLEPLIAGVPATGVVDPHPSPAEPCYTVTAVDAVGNESPPATSQYLNVQLLPLSSLSVSQDGTAYPVISWTHPGGASIKGYDVYLLSGGTGRDTWTLMGRVTGTSFTDRGYAGDERTYKVIAIDTQDQESLPRTVTLPRLSASLKAGEILKRGIMNWVVFEVHNDSNLALTGVQLRVDVESREHLSTATDIPALSTVDVGAVIGGYSSLSSSEPVTIRTQMTYPTGEQITVIGYTNIAVGDALLPVEILNGNLVRGVGGDVQFTLQNTSDVEIEIVTARGASPSDEVRFKLTDTDGNVLSTQPVNHSVGDGIYSLANGDTVARIPAGGSFTVNPATLFVPSNAPQNVVLRLEIDAIYYHDDRDDQVILNGLVSRKSLALIDTAYYGNITEITPKKSVGDQGIVITGQALNREGATPAPLVPLKLGLTLRGFDRVFNIVTDAAGNFTHTFPPQDGESGIYNVWVVHPDRKDKTFLPENTFTIFSMYVNPIAYNIRMPYNYQHRARINLTTRDGTNAGNVRFVYQAADQPGGQFVDGLHVTLGPALTWIPANTSTFLYFDLWAEASDALKANPTGYFIVKVQSDSLFRDRDPVLWSPIRVNYEFFEPPPEPQINPQNLLPNMTVAPPMIVTGVQLSNSQNPADQQGVTESLSVRSTGLAALRNVHVSLLDASLAPLPDDHWVTLGSAAAMGSIPVGESRNVSVNFQPYTNSRRGSVPEGNYTFYLRIESDNYPTVDIGLYPAVTQAGEGNVLFKVTDMYTATLDTQNNVIEGVDHAKILIEHETVSTLTRTVYTDNAGEALLSDLPAGRYKYKVSADKHSNNIGRLWIKPGITVTQEVPLQNDLITVEWEVLPITIQDRYEIVLTATFETNVPAAVVVADPSSVTLPEMHAGDVYNGEFTLTNHGLIRADDLGFDLPADDEFFHYEFLTNLRTYLGAKEKMTVPYRVTCLKSLEGDDGDGSGGGDCRTYIKCCKTTYVYKCANGSSFTNSTYSCVTRRYGTCGGSGGGGPAAAGVGAAGAGAVGAVAVAAGPVPDHSSRHGSRRPATPSPEPSAGPWPSTPNARRSRPAACSAPLPSWRAARSTASAANSRTA
ncbi:MAG: hypothetical protein A3K19_27840 [Lentisphaerae bacterium RIFOXYB12_FULL_65_16]|nr:MAG: hypothetical protein A3K19_27840 [Lentisphaerae bacterium RIFOXYB12_FULL_65_16]